MNQVKGNTYEFGKLPADEPDLMQGTPFFESENEGSYLAMCSNSYHKELSVVSFTQVYGVYQNKSDS